MVVERPALHPHGIAKFTVTHAWRTLHELKESCPRFSEGRRMLLPIRGQVESDLVAITKRPQGPRLGQDLKMVSNNAIAQIAAAL